MPSFHGSTEHGASAKDRATTSITWVPTEARQANTNAISTLIHAHARAARPSNVEYDTTGVTRRFATHDSSGICGSISI